MRLSFNMSITFKNVCLLKDHYLNNIHEYEVTNKLRRREIPDASTAAAAANIDEIDCSTPD